MTVPAVESCPYTVLVVDDEEPLRRYMARVLEGQGYCVLLAANGLEALTLLEQEGRIIDLVITDIMMPLLTGPELAARIAQRPLPPPVLFVSGGHNLPEVPGPILWKPFGAGDLRALTRWILQGGAAPELPGATMIARWAAMQKSRGVQLHRGLARLH
jgi:CheY-like chemotaxis protein